MRVAFRLYLPSNARSTGLCAHRVPELHDLLQSLGVAGLGKRSEFTVAHALPHLLDNTGVVEDEGSRFVWVYRQVGMGQVARRREDPAVALPDWFEADRGLPRGVWAVVKGMHWFWGVMC